MKIRLIFVLATMLLLITPSSANGLYGSNYTNTTNDTCVVNDATCLCEPTEVLFLGTCVKCLVPNCLLCNVEDFTSCDICEEDYQIVNNLTICMKKCYV